MAKSEIKP